MDSYRPLSPPSRSPVRLSEMASSEGRGRRRRRGRSRTPSTKSMNIEKEYEETAEHIIYVMDGVYPERLRLWEKIHMERKFARESHGPAGDRARRDLPELERKLKTNGQFAKTELVELMRRASERMSATVRAETDSVMDRRSNKDKQELANIRKDQTLSDEKVQKLGKSVEELSKSLQRLEEEKKEWDEKEILQEKIYALETKEEQRLEAIKTISQQLEEERKGREEMKKNFAHQLEERQRFIREQIQPLEEGNQEIKVNLQSGVQRLERERQEERTVRRKEMDDLRGQIQRSEHNHSRLFAQHRSLHTLMEVLLDDWTKSTQRFAAIAIQSHQDFGASAYNSYQRFLASKRTAGPSLEPSLPVMHQAHPNPAQYTLRPMAPGPSHVSPVQDGAILNPPCAAAGTSAHPSPTHPTAPLPPPDTIILASGTSPISAPQGPGASHEPSNARLSEEGNAQRTEMPSSVPRPGALQRPSRKRPGPNASPSATKKFRTEAMFDLE